MSSEVQEQVMRSIDSLPRKADDAPQDINLKWYVIHTYSGHEHRVRRSLDEYIARSGLGRYFDDIVVPTEKVIEMRRGQKRTTERNFYPGYVFIHMDMRPDTWHLVNSIPHVCNFIGGKEPTAITEKEARQILDRVEDGANRLKPKVLFAPGELIRITEGPFEDFNGTVEDVNYEKNKLTVSVSIFGRSTPMEIEFDQVEKS